MNQVNPNFGSEWIRSIRLSPNDSKKFGFIPIEKFFGFVRNEIVPKLSPGWSSTGKFILYCFPKSRTSANSSLSIKSKAQTWIVTSSLLLSSFFHRNFIFRWKTYFLGHFLSQSEILQPSSIFNASHLFLAISNTSPLSPSFRSSSCTNS